MEPYETFTWHDAKEKEIGVIRKGLQFMGWLSASSLIVYIVITAFESIV